MGSLENSVGPRSGCCWHHLAAHFSFRLRTFISCSANEIIARRRVISWLSWSGGPGRTVAAILCAASRGNAAQITAICEVPTTTTSPRIYQPLCPLVSHTNATSLTAHLRIYKLFFCCFSALKCITEAFTLLRSNCRIIFSPTKYCFRIRIVY